MPGVRSRVASATSLVIRSRAMVTRAAVQNTRRSAPEAWASPALSIFLFLLAGDAEPRVRQGIQPLEVDLLPALVAVTELLRRAVQAAERLVDVPEIAAFLRGEEELLLALHGVGALIGHVERVRGEIAVGGLQGRVEGVVVVAQLLHDTGPLFQQTLLEMCELFLVHALSVVCGPLPARPSSRATP